MSDVFNRSSLSIGQMVGALALAAPVIYDAAGALGALASSLGAATAGFGALAVGAVGAATVGLAGVTAIIAPAIGGLSDLMSAQESANKAQVTGADSAARSAASGAQQIRAAREQVVTATQGVEQAEESLEAAQDSARFAQEELTEAREEATRQLQDMRRAVVEGATAEQRAQLTLRQARRNLEDLIRSGTASALDLESAQLDIVEARQSSRDATIEQNRAEEDLNRSQRGGVKNMPQVVAAQRGLNDAMRGVGDAQEGVATAHRDVSAALRDLAFQQKQTNQAAVAGASSIAALELAQRKAGPMAVRFARGLKDLEQRWRRLTRAGQGQFFGLLNDGLDRLNRKLPLFADSANRSMKALRGGFNAFLDRATGPEFDRFINVMTRTFAKSIGPVSKAFGNIAKVLQRIAVAVAPDIIRIAGKFEEMTKGWLDSTKNARALRETVHGLVRQTEAWWDLLVAAKDLVVTALVPGMGAGKNAVKDMTDQLKEWTRWIDAHPVAVKDFFKDGVANTKRVLSALISFVPIFVQWSKAMRPIIHGLASILQLLNRIKIPFTEIRLLTALIGALLVRKVVTSVLKFAAAYKAVRTAILGATAAQTAFNATSMLAPGKVKGGKGVPVATTAAAASALPFAGMGGVPIKKAPSKAAGAFPFAGMGKSFQGADAAAKWSTQLGKLAKVAGPVALAITAVAGAFLALKDNFLGVRDVFTGFFDKVLEPLGDAFTDLIDELSGGHSAQVFGAIGAALGLVAKPMKWIVENLTKLLGLAALGAIFTGLGVAIALVAAPIWLAIKGLTLLVKGIKGIGGAVKDAAGFIKDHWGPVGRILGAPFRFAWDIAKKVLRGIRDLVGTVVGFISDRWGNIKQILSAPFRAVGGVARAAFEAVIGRVRDAIGFIKDRWSDVGRILTAPFRTMRQVVKRVIGFVESLISSIKDAINKVGDLLDKLPDLPSLPGKGGGVPFVPGVHRGGFVTERGIVSLTGFQRGGMVGGRGPKPGPRDKIPALLEVGELVIPKKLVDDASKGSKKVAVVLKDEIGKGYKQVSENSKGFVKRHGRSMEDLRKKAADQTKRFRKTTVDDFEKTDRAASDRTQRMRVNVTEGYERMRERATDQTGRMKQGVGQDFQNMTGAVSEGLRRIAKMTNNSLKALGVKKVDFQIAAERKQRGGHIGGTGSGDKVPALLEPGEFVINKMATKVARPMLEDLNRDVPRFQTGGMVDRTGVQHFAKGGMAAMIARADKFERREFPYVWGGGHGGFGIQPVDCSGAVSDILHAAGLLETPMVSGDLAHWGKAGKGPLTVYADPGHTFMSLAGKFFGTSSSNPSGGAGWFAPPDRGYLSGFAARTMDVAGGIAARVKRLLLKGPDGPMKDMGQAALDKSRRAANAYIDKKMPGGKFGGGQTLKDFSKGPGKIVGASVYGFGEPGTGTVGASGVSLPGKPAFAELDMGTALGHLPFGKKVGIEVGGKKAVGIKLDIGLGGGSVGGRPRAIDFWRDLAEKLGLSGSFLGLAKVKGLQEGGVVDRTGIKHRAIAAPFVGSFDQGGPVKQTGFGLLHKGEQVVPKLARGGFITGGRPEARGGRDVRGFGVERVRLVRTRLSEQINKIIPRFEENIDIAERLAGLASSPGGSELSKGEFTNQLGLQRRLLGVLKKTLNIAKRGVRMVESSIKKIERDIKRIGKAIEREERKEKPDRKRLAGLQEDLRKRTNALVQVRASTPVFRDTMTEMSGLTGRGGRIFDTSIAIKELRAQGRAEPLHIAELLEFAEALKFGAFKRSLGDRVRPLPTFAQGGTVPGPLGKPVPVIAHGGEHFLGVGGAPVVEVKIAEGMGWLRKFIEVETKNRDRGERASWRREVVAR